MSKSRRNFPIASSAALVGAVLTPKFDGQTQTPPPAGTPPVFGTAPPVGAEGHVLDTPGRPFGHGKHGGCRRGSQRCGMTFIWSASNVLCGLPSWRRDQRFLLHVFAGLP